MTGGVEKVGSAPRADRSGGRDVGRGLKKKDMEFEQIDYLSIVQPAAAQLGDDMRDLPEMRPFSLRMTIANRAGITVEAIVKPGRAVAPRQPRSARGADPTICARGLAIASRRRCRGVRNCERVRSQFADKEGRKDG